MSQGGADGKRGLAGRRAQRNGAGWENLFQSHARRAGIVCIRFPDGCRRVAGPGGKPRLLPVRTPFDWILSVPGHSAYVDTKTVGGGRFQYNQVKEHQVEALLALHTHGHAAGYVVHFQDLNAVLYFDAMQLAGLGPRESLGPEDGVLLGSVFGLELKLIWGGVQGVVAIEAFPIKG